jgi:hypothetical protein
MDMLTSSRLDDGRGGHKKPKTEHIQTETEYAGTKLTINNFAADKPNIY